VNQKGRHVKDFQCRTSVRDLLIRIDPAHKLIYVVRSRKGSAGQCQVVSASPLVSGKAVLRCDRTRPSFARKQGLFTKDTQNTIVQLEKKQVKGRGDAAILKLKYKEQQSAKERRRNESLLIKLWAL
jgi:hypothetical protein